MFGKGLKKTHITGSNILSTTSNHRIIASNDHLQLFKVLPNASHPSPSFSPDSDLFLLTLKNTDPSFQASFLPYL